MKNEFDVVAISKMWCNDNSINVNSLYEIPNYISFHKIQKIGNKGGGLAMHIHKTITFKTLNNNNKHIESFSVEIIRKNQKNIILLCIYRPPRGDQNICTSKIKDLIERYKQNQKSKVLVDDLNLNYVDYTTNNHAQNF